MPLIVSGVIVQNGALLFSGRPGGGGSDSLLMETGEYLLLETGDRILIE